MRKFLVSSHLGPAGAFTWNWCTQIFFLCLAVSEKGDRAVEWTYFPEESLLLQLITRTVCSHQPILVSVPQRQLGPLRESFSAGASAARVTLNANSCFFHFLPLPLLASWGLNPRIRLLRGRKPDLRHQRALPSSTATGHAPGCPCEAGPGTDLRLGCPSLRSSELLAIQDLEDGLSSSLGCPSNFSSL